MSEQLYTIPHSIHILRIVPSLSVHEMEEVWTVMGAAKNHTPLPSYSKVETYISRSNRSGVNDVVCATIYARRLYVACILVQAHD